MRRQARHEAPRAPGPDGAERAAQAGMRTAGVQAMDNPSWYKDAVVYQLHVKSFCDSNGDGIGDFPGLTSRLDYIASLGVNTIWLLPFYPSPRRDDGYDIADYRAIHPDYGTMRDFRRFVAEAHRRGLRIVTELVVNHTSDRHPWFQRARRAPKGSWQRDFYVWADDDKGFPETRIIFLDTETSNWAWDDAAKAYYWHRFYSHQPDLNFDNPRVLREIISVLHFWAKLGVDGFRLDAVPYLIERPGTINENLPETHDILKRIRAEVDAHFPGRMLLAEANQWPEDVKEYFGAGDECHMCFHFPLMPRMYMGVAQEDRYPITDILRQTPDIPDGCQWAIFLRNHDELTLEMVTDEERDYLWNTYAADRRARINLGIRRRLAPLMEHDRRRIELMNFLLLSLPGTPVIYYGDEIGMGDNIFLGDRDGVRTPMQWSPDRNGGFSRAEAARLVLPANTDPLTGFQTVNVEAQEQNRHSLLNWTRRMVTIRQARTTFGRGALRLLYPGNRKVLAYLREHGDETILCVANLSRAAQAVELDLSANRGRVPVELTARTAFPPIGDLPYLLTLPPYGFFWFVLAREADLPSWHSPPPAMLPEFETLVLQGDITALAAGPNRSALEQRILPAWLPLRRWSAGDSAPRLALTVATPLRTAEGMAMLAEVEATQRGAVSRYLVPLALAMERADSSALTLQLALARIRRGRSVGHLTDGFARDALALALLDALREGRSLPDPAGEVVFRPAPGLAALDLPEGPEIARLGAEQANTSFLVGGQVVLKLLRRLEDGIHPEAEMTRLLTARGFTGIPPFLGDAVRVTEQGERCLVVAHGFIRNQGDAWRWLQDMLARALDDTLAAAARGEAGEAAPFATARSFLVACGRRIAEMHTALALPSDDADTAPRHADAARRGAWQAAAAESLALLFEQLERRRTELPAEVAALAARVLAARRALTALARRAVPRGATTEIRVHGDLSLPRILAVSGEPIIIGFEGDPARPLAERRARSHPARDVATMLLSLAASAEAALADPGPPPAAAPDPRQKAIARWHEEARAAFLAACFADPTPGPWPADFASRERLIALFLADAASRDALAALDTRPARATAPLRELLRLSGASHDDA